MVSIRRFEKTDQEQIRELITTIMSEEFKEDQAVFPTADIENIPQSYGGLGEAFFVATNGQQVVGTVAVKREDDRIALMRRLFVAAAYRKKQIGLQLIDRALEFCEEVGYKEVIFRTTSRMESATKICQKKGFTPRAKLKMGDIELYKLAVSLRDGLKKVKVS
ncbi:MAG: GNAT family N-acetyltransferase [Candidatus Omnitrophica bacterium]|nr:GNAT family N-acetyltransferase [Candidatus Omnitrophota bacterium]